MSLMTHDFRAPKILILSVGSGAGHNRAGKSLALAFQREIPGAEVRFLDMLDLPGSRRLKRQIDGEYRRIEKSPEIWASAYIKYDRPPDLIANSLSFKSEMFQRRLKRSWIRLGLERAFSDYLNQANWNLVISTHIYATSSYLRFKNASPELPPIAYVSTDFFPHRNSIIKEVDHFYAATDESAEYISTLLMDPAQVSAFGIPISDDFSILPDNKSCRAFFNLLPELPVVLLLSGGYGMDSAENSFRHLLSVDLPMQIVVNAGKNPSLLKRLQEESVPTRHQVKVIGFTDQIAKLMGAADIVISKPGGLISSEILACGAGMAILHPLPGAEQYNSHYLLENGAAVNIEHPELLPVKLPMLLSSENRLDSLRKNAAGLGRPNAARNIARDLTDRFL